MGMPESDLDKKLKFVQAMTKHGLAHFAAGGTALDGPTSSGTDASAPNPNDNGILGWLGGILGTNNQYKAKGAQIQAGTNAAQLNNAYEGAQGALDAQGRLTGVLQGQANQGAGTQSNLTRMLTDQANGVGPNPAQTQLNAATGQNVQNQAALMAGQRGASTNPALIARLAAQQGAATQQQAVGQSATLGAQQQLAAEQQLQGLAGSQVGQGAGAVGALNQAQQSEQAMLQQANAAENNANVSMQSNINNVNAGVSGGNQSMAGNILGGITSGISSAAGLMAHGGEVHRFAPGGIVSNPLMSSMPVSSAPQSFVGNYLNNTIPTAGPSIEPTQMPAMMKSNLSENGKKAGSALASVFSKKDSSKMNGGPDGTEIDPSFGEAIMPEAAGGLIRKALAAKGGKVNARAGEKAVKGDNSYANDKIPAMLSEDEIVLPRSVTTHPDAPRKAAEFVMAVQAKKKQGLVRRAAA